MSKHYKKNQEPTLLETIFIGMFKGLWFLVTLPFKKRRKKAGISDQDKQKIIEKRQEIEKLISSGNQYELKHAVMEADKLVDQILKLKGYLGDTFADRLRNAEKHIDQNTYQNIWAGHKVRNTLAHESEVIISESELKNTVRKLLNYR